MSIYVTAILKSKQENTQELKSILENMVINSRKEAACEKYELQQGLDDETLFIFHEIWKDQAGLDLHNSQTYFLEFLEKVPNLLEKPAYIYLANVIA